MKKITQSKIFKMTAATVAAGLLLAGCSSGDASDSTETADGYPNKQIQLMLPWGAGGDSDVIARTINKYLEEELDVKIVVTNMGGGGCTIGAQEFMKQDPDGYSMMAGHDSIAVSYLMGKADFSYDDFEPIALATTANQLIATNVANDWENMQDVVDELKENPESISFGASIGSTTHIVPLGIMDSQDVKFNIVAYEGTAQRTQALLGNHLDLGSTTIPAAKEYKKANQLKMLGIAAEERNPALPEVPTLKEQGIDFVNATNRGYFFPKDTPQEIVDLMDEALQNVAENPEFIEEMETMGVDVNYKNTEEYKKYLQDDVEHLEGMLTRQNIIE